MAAMSTQKAADEETPAPRKILLERCGLAFLPLAHGEVVKVDADGPIALGDDLHTLVLGQNGREDVAGDRRDEHLAAVVVGVVAHDLRSPGRGKPADFSPPRGGQTAREPLHAESPLPHCPFIEILHGESISQIAKKVNNFREFIQTS